MRTISNSPKKLNRWMRLGIATITSTALVGGVVVAAPAHPLLPAAQVAQAQEIPAEADAYAFAQQLNLSALEGLLSTDADDDRTVAEILTLLEAEQAWDAESDNDQGAVTSDIQVELLEALNITIGDITLPLVGANGLLQGELGALSAYANAPAADEARAAAGLITDTGAVDFSGTGTGANANLDLTSVLGLSEALAPLLDEASLNLGALSSAAWDENGTNASEYQVADAQLTIESPLVSDLVGEVEGIVGGLDDLLNNGLIGSGGLLDSILGSELVGLLGDVEVTATVPVNDILTGLWNTPLSDESGLVSIDLQTGQINVDVAQLHGGDLNNLPANTSLLTAEELTQITDTVTSLLTDSAVDNPNGLNARLEEALLGDPVAGGGLYDTELSITTELLGGSIGPIELPSLTDIEIDATLGGLLNDNVQRAETLAEYEADPNNRYYLQAEVIGLDLSLVVENVVVPLLGGVGDLVDELLFGADAGTGLLGGVLGNVQSEVLTPLLNELDPLLQGVLQPVADIVVNRQQNDGELFEVSALELNLLDGAVTLPIATSAVAAFGDSTPGDGDDEIDAPVITPIDNQEVVLGDDIDSVTVDVDDPEAVVTVTDLPEGVSFDPDTLVISGIPAELGEYTVTVTAANDGGTDTETFVINVVEDDGGDTPGDGDDNGSGPGGSLPGSSDGDNGSGDLFPGSSNDETGNGNDGNGSSADLQQCLASPETGLAALLAVLGVTAAVSGPVIDPIVRAVGEQFSAQVRLLTGSTPENDPAWLNQINAGLAEAANAMDSRIVATALFGSGALALIFADDLCGTGNEGLSSQLSS